MPAPTSPPPAVGDELSGLAADPLPWLASLLWPDGNGDGQEPWAERYAVVPTARRPRLLVPLHTRATAAAAVTRSSAGGGRAARWARHAAAQALRAGLLQPALRARVSPAAGGLLDHLRTALDPPPAAMSVRLSTVRPNSKPVLQLMTASGEVLGYAKVGWNPLTRRLVTAEAATLARLPRPLRHVAAPSLRYRGSWRGLEVSVQSALPDGGRAWPAGRGAVVAALGEIAALAGVQRQPLGASSYLRGLRARLAPDGSPLASRVAGAVERLADRYGALELAFGSWHGDFTVWNTRALPGPEGRLAVWDWERSAADVPVGFDALHHALNRPGPERAYGQRLDGAAAVAGDWLAALGVASEDAAAVTLLHRAELLARIVEDGPGAATPMRRARAEVLLAHLERDLPRGPAGWA